MDPYQHARELIDAAHAADPMHTASGKPAELVYAENMERWVVRVAPEAGPVLRLAARCQHLERWSVPRASFPLDKPGYHAWRKSLYQIQANRARELLFQAGVPATEADWSEEYLAAVISIKVVSGVDEAIAHINRYSTHHTDAIVTRDHVHAQRFLREVDSASVMVNASTRFADGFEYGLGAEIGISTDKFHARGPVGLEGLTSMKWVVLGQGEVRT